MGACRHVPPASAFLVSRELQAPEAVITPLGPWGRWFFAFRSSPRSELFFRFCHRLWRGVSWRFRYRVALLLFVAGPTWGPLRFCLCSWLLQRCVSQWAMGFTFFACSSCSPPVPTPRLVCLSSQRGCLRPWTAASSRPPHGVLCASGDSAGFQAWLRPFGSLEVGQIKQALIIPASRGDRYLSFQWSLSGQSGWSLSVSPSCQPAC